MKKALLLLFSLRTAVFVLVISVFAINGANAQSWAWQRISGYGRPNSANNGKSICTDKWGYVYVAGSYGSYGTGSFGDSISFGTTVLSASSSNQMFIAKYDSLGNCIWAHKATGAPCTAWAVTTDATGKLYVGGESDGTIAFGSVTILGGGAFLVKFDSAGHAIWGKVGSGGGYPTVFSIATDTLCNVYISGQYANSLHFGSTYLSSTLYSSSGIFAAKYDSAGTLSWANSVIGATTSTESTYGGVLTVDAFGDLYITGASYAATLTSGGTIIPCPGNERVILLKLNASTGSIAWLRRTGGNNGGQGNSVITDKSGNIYLTGWYESSGFSFGSSTFSSGSPVNMLLLKYDSSGNEIWGRVSGEGGNTTGTTIAFDNSQHIFLSGFSNSNPDYDFGASTFFDITPGTTGFVVKYDTLGYAIWAKQINDSESVADSSNTSINSVATYGVGNVYITGSNGFPVYIAKIKDSSIFTGIISGTLSICAGSTSTLTDTVSGGTWSSSDTSIATVGSTTGVVTAISYGTVFIFYTVAGSSSTVTIQVSSGPDSIIENTSICLGATGTMTDAIPGGTWSCSAPSIASISSIGVVTGITTGIATISYNLTNNCGSFLATKIVTVNPIPATITGLSVICIAGTTTLSDSVTGGTWRSSTPGVASIDSNTGIVTGISSYWDIVTYTLPGGCYKTFYIAIGTPITTAIAGTPSVCTGNFTTLTDSTSGGVWTSGTTTVATISGTGIITGVAAGTANISYTKAGCYVTKAVTVNTNPLAANTGTMVVCAGNTTTLSNTTSGGTWTSSIPADATVGSSTGVVTGVAAGSPYITYSLSSGCYKTSLVSVGAPITTSITGTTSVCAGGSHATLADATTGGVWSSSATTIAMVGSTGIVTGVVAGTATITYTKSGCYVTQPVTVNTNPLAANTGTMIVCAGNTTTLSNSTSGGTWTSSIPADATVGSTTGIVTGVAAGSPMIVYTLPSGCFKNAMVTVGTPITTAITGTASVCAGGATTTLADATTGGAWTSSTTTVATVGTTGIVSGVAAGTATISYTKTGCYVTKPVTVNTNPLAANTGTMTVCAGNTTTLANTTSGGTWTSSIPADATVGSSTGIVTGVAAGVPIITYALSSGCYKASGVTVGTPITTAITGTASVCAGGATTTLADATTGGAWTSSTTTVATIGTTGIVSGVVAGTATITYTKTGCYVTQPITVNTNPLAANTGTMTVCAGNTTTLANTTSGGTWSSSITADATVGSGTGIVTGVAAGSPYITYTLSSGCYKASGVIVGAPITTAITGTTSVCAGGSHTTLADATTGGTWTSGATTIATIASTGIASGVAAGTATITYTKSGCYVTQPITVNTNPLSANTGTMIVCAGNTTTLANSTSGGTWSSSITADATVGSGTGIVTGVAAGSPYITYTLLSSGCYKASGVTVGAPITTAITGTTSVCAGGSHTTLADATTGGVWTSGATTVATVGTTGIVSGVAAGTATISYTKAGCYVTQPVTVNTNPLSAITGTTTVCVGSITTLANTTSGGTWTSSITADATVGSSTGIVTGVAAGSPVITYLLSSGCYKTSYVYVHTPPTTITGTGAVCTSTPVTLTEGTPGGAWSSSATTRATVSTTGVVTGHTAGTAIISYSVIGCTTATFPVTVSACRIGDIGNEGDNTNGEQVNVYGIYPNPSNGLIYIEQSIPVDMTTGVRIVNYLGQSIYAGSMEFTGGKGQISLAEVVPGVYMVELKDAKGQAANFRLVIEK